MPLTMLTAAPSVRRLACGVTLLLWILAIHQHDRSFCVGFARYLSSESNWTILIRLVSIVEAVSDFPTGMPFLSVTLLLVRLVLRIGLLGESASERAAQCDDGFPGPSNAVHTLMLMRWQDPALPHLLHRPLFLEH